MNTGADGRDLGERPVGRSSGAGASLRLSAWQREAIERWTLIPEEQARPRFAHVTQHPRRNSQHRDGR
jgi:hypothetical protein